MKTAVIVQARLGSTRLPAKVLLPLPTGRTVLEEVLWRCAQIEGVDALVLAIPDTPENDILERITLRKQSSKPIALVRGPEHDVLARYAKAAEAVGADVIMRVTADCPLLDPEVCGKTLDLHSRINHGYVSNSWPTRTYPQGFDCEVFNRDVLERAHESAERGPCVDERGIRHIEEPDREHVTPWMQRQPDIERACLSTMEDRSHLRWTLDTLADYVVIWNIFQEQMRAAA